MRFAIRWNIVSIFLGLLSAQVTWGATVSTGSPVTRYAVIDIAVSANISKSLAADVSGAIKTEISKQTNHTVLDRQMMNRLLSGRKCGITSYSRECFSESGRLLNVQKIVAGNLVLHKGVYYCLLMLINGETGVIENITEDEFVAESNKVCELVAKIASLLTNNAFYTRDAVPEPDFLRPAEMFTFNMKIYENPARDFWQKPETVIAKLPLRHGDTVADMGTGTGYFIPWLSKAVGEKGTVYALDTQKEMTDHVAIRVEKAGLKNVRALHVSPGDPSLPENSVDLFFLCSMYYEIRDNNTYLTRLKNALKKEGKIVILDFKVPDFPIAPPMSEYDSLLGSLASSKVPRRILIPNILDINHNKNSPFPIGPTFLVRLPQEKVIAEMTKAGFMLFAQHDVLPYQYFLVFSKE